MKKTAAENAKDRLLAEAEKAKCQPEDLDELVIDFKEAEASDDNNAADSEEGDEERIDARCQEASDINNGGLDAQFEYIFGCLDEKDAEQRIRQSLKLGIKCVFCTQYVPPKTAHRHQDDWVCDECWDERLRASE
jgi:hypothetical protein